MRTLGRFGQWRRWSVTALGVLLCGVISGVVTVTQIQLTSLQLLQIGLPFVVALILVAYGVWLVNSDVSTDRIPRIALWSLAGAIVVGSFATWEMYIHTLEGEAVVESVHELLLGVTEGSIAGGLVGYYDVRRKDQYLEAEKVRQAMSASMDGIAVLNEDGEYETVNQAHADVYGYDDPDDFVGETWHLCYTEAEAARVEEEVISELDENGHWRGELTGRRRDGSTFPQEL